MPDKPVPTASVSSWNVSPAARRLHRDALVWDNHAGFGPDPSVDLEMLEIWRAAGVDYLSVNVGYDLLSWQQTVKNIGAFITWFEKHPDRFTLVRRAEDIPAAKRAGRMAIAFDLEGMNALDGEAYMVSFFYRLGVRQMLFAYNRNNLAGGGCHDDADPGLTAFGRRVIEEMNRVGMMVDCSHTGYRTTMAVLEAASAPVIFSHSNPKALRAHGRNIMDEQIRACARTGGVVGINGIGLFLPDREATTDTMVDCLCYVADLAGVDHVGIGLDYAPAMPDDPLDDLTRFSSYFWPAGEGYDEHLEMAEPAQLPEITDRLLTRGWPEEDIRKVLGENFLRVARTVWK
jgi:membrane dipeptidase